MATWKKVLVSGSAANLTTLQVDNLTSGLVTANGTSNLTTTAVNGTGNIVATTGANNVSMTGSFTGSFTGNGAGLTGVTATAVFPTSQTTPILATTKVFTNDGSGNTYVFAGQITASTYAGITGDISINTAGVAAIGSGVIVNADVASNAAIDYTKLNLASSTIHSGSFFNGITVVSGSSQINGTQITNNTITIAGNSTALGGSVTQAQILASSGVWSGSAQLPSGVVSGSSQVSYTGLSNIPSGIISSSVLSAPATQANITLTNNGTAQTIAINGLGTTDSPTHADLTLTGGDLIATTTSTFNLINTNQTTVNFAGAATSINIGASTGTTTVNNDVRVKGTLYVDGPVTAISSSNLYVADQFILLASGSANNNDGGIIIDRGAYAAGNIAFGYDATTTRWGFQDGLVDTTNAIDPTANSGVSGSFVPYLFTEASHGATRPTTGEFAVVGSMYMSNAGDFWIYTV